MNSLDFILLRTPLQSFDLAFSEIPSVLNPNFVNGLRQAAPDFFREYQKNLSTNSKDDAKLKESFYKYWIRSCMRCTPFGYFAGSKIIKIEEGETTSIILNESRQHNPNARLDMGYLFLLKTEIEKNINVKNQVIFTTNNSLYETQLDFRYSEYVIKNGTRSYKLSSVEKTEYLTFILNFAAKPRTLSELTNTLAEYSGVAENEAHDFILDMIETQLLLSNLELTLTGVDPLQNLIKCLMGFVGVEDFVSKLKNIHHLLRNLQNEDYGLIERRIIEEFPLETPSKDIVQVDLALSTKQNFISRRMIDEIVDQSGLLFYLSRLGTNPSLESFKSKFIERYDRAEMPLNLILDSDLGIGYGDQNLSGSNEWIENLPIGVRSNDRGYAQDYITDYTFSKYQDYIREKRNEIELTETELRGLKNKSKGFNFPTSMYLFGSILAIANDSGNDQNLMFDLNQIGGPSAATMLGRFTLSNEELTELTKKALEDEEAQFPNSIFAEIVHIPQTRLGNILLRSHLRKYEIPYLGKSGLDVEYQILLNDLMVSIKENKVILRSIKNNKRIFPRLSTAHNFSAHSLPIYKFLCDLQSQDYAYPNIWDWGVFSNEVYLPRVRYKNLILKRARWLVSEKDIIGWDNGTDEVKLAVKLLREKIKLPRHILLIQGDNNLLIDLEEIQSISLLSSFIKKYKKVVVEEFLFNSENCIVKDVNNSPYINEVIIPVNRKYESPEVFNVDNELVVHFRKFIPNSEWLFIKIYGGEKTLEKLLLTVILPHLEDWMKESFFEKFFFIRYRDPDEHIRLRFFNSNIPKQATLQDKIMKLLEPWLVSEQLNRVVIDTYFPEIERYSKFMVQSESLFFNDSLAVLRLNNLLSEIEDSQKYKMLFAMRGIDFLLNDFDFNLEDKLSIAKDMSISFLKEFGNSDVLKQTLNDKYRKIKKEIFSHMDEGKDLENNIEEAIDIFQERSEMNRELVLDIKSIMDKENYAVKVQQLLRDYLHMFMNRFFISQQRKYELVVYSFLERYYSSQNAIKTKILRTK